jgi:hypothetical protein
MKTPKWFKQHLATIGGRVLERESTEDQGADDLTDQIFDKGEGFARAIVREYARKQLKNWVTSHRRGTPVDEDTGQTDLFPQLPRNLEVAPGRFAAQAVMTRRDWDAALKQAETKANNAGGHYEAVKQVYDQVRPLLTSDELTTAEVWKSTQLGRAIGGT